MRMYRVVCLLPVLAFLFLFGRSEVDRTNEMHVSCPEERGYRRENNIDIQCWDGDHVSLDFRYSFSKYQ